MRKQCNATKKNGANEREFGAVLRARDAFDVATRGQSNSMTLHQNSQDGVIELRRTTDVKTTNSVECVNSTILWRFRST